MGYKIRITNSKVRLSATYFKHACDHLLSTSFLEENDNMSGAKYQFGEVTTRYYAWVNMDRLKTALENGNLPEVFSLFGFTYMKDVDGNINSFIYDDKSGDEEHLLNCLREYFDEDDFIEFEGEDGRKWKYVFKNTWMYCYEPVEVWSVVDIFK